jgi:putative transposase
MFGVLLAYPLAEGGSMMIEVPANRTRQACAESSVIDARSRRDQARFVCAGCHHEANADTKAAVVMAGTNQPASWYA